MLLVSPSRILVHNYTTTLASPEDVNNHRAPDSARYQEGQRTWNSAASDSPHLRHLCHKSLDHFEAEHAANLKDQWWDVPARYRCHVRSSTLPQNPCELRNCHNTPRADRLVTRSLIYRDSYAPSPHYLYERQK